MINQWCQVPEFGLEHLQVVEAQSQALKPGQVRVKWISVSLNYRDLLMVKGQYNPKIPRPLIPCSDGAGLVVEVADDVSQLKVGQQVISCMVPGWQAGRPPANAHSITLGGPAAGCLQTLGVHPQEALLPFANLDFDAASCLPVAALTAWRSLQDAGVQAGDSVLTLGTGGVSIFALQIAKEMGCRVTITSSSDEKLERAKRLGADHLVNYRTFPEWEKKVLEHEPGGVNCVIELGGPGTLSKSVQATGLGGHIALIGVLAKGAEPPNLMKVLMKNICLQGTLVGNRHQLAELVQFCCEKKLDPVIDQRFEGLEEAGAALRHMEQGQHMGKIVIRLQDP